MGHQRRVSNNVIATGLSNLKRRKRQQDTSSNGIMSFRNSFYSSNGSLGALYKNKPANNNFWGVSSNVNSSLNNINRRSKDKLIPQNARQSLHLKLKKKIFHNSKNSVGDNRREINMVPLNSYNRKNFNEKSYNGNPKNDKSHTSLDSYHTKSYENVIKSSSSMVFKNLNSNKPKPVTRHVNHKMLTSLTNKNIKEDLKKIKRKRDPGTEGSTVDAYSYDKTKKGKTMGSSEDIEDNSGNTTPELFPSESHSHQKHQKQNSLVNKMSDEFNNHEEKKYGSEGRVNEYEDGLPKGFDSPFEYKAISPSPHLNNSAMSKEVALENCSSRLKEDESKKDTKDFPLTPEKAVKYYKAYLSEYEETEILNYSSVFYINTNVKIDPKTGRKSKKNTQEFKVIKGEQL